MTVAVESFGPIHYLVHKAMLPFLTFSYEHVFPNYGFAIVLLTVLIKVMFFPLMQKQLQSMKVIQKLGPEIQSIRDKYASEPQKVHMETLALYKSHNVNPFSGCLPMLIQIPFFIAIYATIASASFKELLTQPGINPGLFPFWLSNLSVPDATYILPVAVAALTYWSQSMMMTDPMQRKFLFLSPIMILVFGFRMPCGVLLYWAASTLLSTAQQVWVMKKS